MAKKFEYHIEHNGECFQSVFPEAASHFSQLHTPVSDALQYMVIECAVDPDQINVSNTSEDIVFDFDVKLFVTAHVTAKTFFEARKKLKEVVDCIDIGFNRDDLQIGEACADGELELTAIDGESV